MSTITSRLPTTPSPNSDQSAPRRRYRRAIAFAVIIATAVYACFFHNFRPQEDWVPGTTKTWPLSNRAAPATCIAFIDGLDQPIVGGDGVIESVDGESFVRDVHRIDSQFALHSGNTPLRISGSVEAVFGQYTNKEVFVLKPTQRPKVIHDGTRVSIDPQRYGSDDDHFVQLSTTPGQFFRLDRKTGKPQAEPLELPTNRGDVYKFGTDSWISLEAIDRRVTLQHASGSEYVCEGTFPEITICDDGCVILSVHTGGLTLHTLKFADENWQRLSEPFVNKHPNVRSLAFDPVKCRVLLLEDKFGTARTSMFRSVVDGYGALLLVDCATGEVIARHDVKVQSPADRLPSSPWFRATFSPDGQKLFIVTTLSRCIEVDVDTWIEACQ